MSVSGNGEIVTCAIQITVSIMMPTRIMELANLFLTQLFIVDPGFVAVKASTMVHVFANTTDLVMIKMMQKTVWRRRQVPSQFSQYVATEKRSSVREHSKVYS